MNRLDNKGLLKWFPKMLSATWIHVICVENKQAKNKQDPTKQTKKQN